MEVFMKRILLVIILGLVLAGCNFFSGGKDDYTELFDNIEDAGELRDSFYEAVDEKIDDDGQSLTFAADLFMVSTADLSASLYLAVVELYLVTPKLSTVDIEKKGDTYTFSDEDENEQVKVKFDQKTNSYSLEVSKDGTVTLVSEMTKLGKNHFAYQIYTDSNEKKCVYQMLLMGEDGKLSVDEEATKIPSTIYKAKSVPKSFATSGTRVYILDKGEFSFEGSLSEQKTVTNFTIVSGLKQQYELNEEIFLTGIKIRITYSDGSTEEIYVTSSMVVGTVPDTSSTGTKTLKLKYGGIQKSFTFEVVEDGENGNGENGNGENGEETASKKLQQSFLSFSGTFASGTPSFLGSLANAAFSESDPQKLLFYEEFSNASFSLWSNITLLLEGISVITAHEAGTLDALFPDPANNYGKTAYVTYNEETQTFAIGYWNTKGLYTYWFEQEISYDEATDSLRAVAKCGVDEEQLIRGYTEYKKIVDGNYAANLYFPVDENDDEGLYTNYEFRFTQTEGVISQNLWADPPATLYRTTADLSDYGKQGDKTMTLVDGTLTFVDRLTCQSEIFWKSFMGEDGEYEGSLEQSFLQRMADAAEASGGWFDESLFTLTYSALNDYLWLLADYEKKVLDLNQFDKFTFTMENDSKTIITEEYGEETTFVFRYKSDKISQQLSLIVTFSDGAKMVAELVRNGSRFYIQLAQGLPNEYDTYRAAYHDNNNMYCASSFLKKFVSIYGESLEGYAETGDYVHKIENGVYSFVEK